MKLSMATSFFVLAIMAAPRIAYGADEDFANILSLVAQIKEEAESLAIKYADKESELAALLETCGGGGGGVSLRPRKGSGDVPTKTSSDDGKDSSTDEGSVTAASNGNTMVGAPKKTSGSSEDTTTTDPSTPDDNKNYGGPQTGGGNWTPKIGDTWNYNLAKPVDTNAGVNVYFIDMDGAQKTIDTIHNNGGAVICYISIGTVEDWRSDAGDIPNEAIGGDVDGWAGEKWLDVNNQGVRDVMSKRVAQAANMNCDGIEPDNMMAFLDAQGVTVSEGDQIKYNRWFAGICHDAGMKVGMKNAVEIVPVMVDDFDFALNEGCFQWDECEVYEDTFIAKGKPVFNVEYKNMDQCTKAKSLQIDSIVKNYNLEAAVCSCNDNARNIDCDSVM